MTSPNLDARLNTYSPTIISVFRVIVGLLFTIHGISILFDWPFPPLKPVSVGEWPGWWAGLIEFVTGLLVAAGLFTRPAAFIASGQMAVAYFWQHVLDPPPQVTKSFWPHVNGGELAVLFCFSFLLILFIGPGAYAIDTMRRRRPVAGSAVGGPARPRPGS
ncbi:MAG TPA: DoxX family protein [Mycobacterium sp.]|nr:DoxX family protein [Mycobacterium sp.]